MSIDLSRVENILETMLGRSEIKEPAQSRVEELLIELKEAIEEGGTGGDVTALTARIAKCERDISSIETVDETQTQQIQSIVTSLGEFRTAIENLDTDVENKVDKEAGKGLSTNDYTTAEKEKLAGIEAQANKTVVDDTLSNSSTNPVQNKVVKSALESKQTSLTTDQLAAANSGITEADVTQMRTNSIKLVYRRHLGQNSGTASYRMVTTDFTAIDNAQQCGIYLITIINWSATPTASVYIAYYSGGTTSYNALTKIGGVDAQINIDENRYINYTGNGKIQIYALQ